MKTSEKNFIMVTESSDTIIVDDYLEELLRKEMRPILWFRDGLFCVVPVEILMNIIEAIDHYVAHLSMMRLTQVVHWSQGHVVYHNTGHALSGLID